jgi:hypothetical protein
MTTENMGTVGITEEGKLPSLFLKLCIQLSFYFNHRIRNFMQYQMIVSKPGKYYTRVGRGNYSSGAEGYKEGY